MEWLVFYCRVSNRISKLIVKHDTVSSYALLTQCVLVVCIYVFASCFFFGFACFLVGLWGIFVCFVLFSSVGNGASIRLMEQNYASKNVVQFGWGFLWNLFVCFSAFCFVVVVCLVFGFVFGG